MLGAKKSAVPPDFQDKVLFTHRKVMRYADNGAAVEAYFNKFRSALESPFATPQNTALTPPAARFDYTMYGYYSFS